MHFEGKSRATLFIALLLATNACSSQTINTPNSTSVRATTISSEVQNLRAIAKDNSVKLEWNSPKINQKTPYSYRVTSIPDIGSFNLKPGEISIPNLAWAIFYTFTVTLVGADWIGRAKSITVGIGPQTPENSPCPQDLLALVNKNTPPLDATCSPGFRENDALGEMFAAMGKDGLHPIVVSSYRSYYTQTLLYNSYVASLGRLQAQLISAKPGFSEHQLGLAVDISDNQNGGNLNSNFALTPTGEWLLKNSRQYGFILRYPQGQTAITGYDYEPWHYRFVGPRAVEIPVGESLETYLDQFLVQA